MRTGRNNKNGGFSLVELIIVVAIMAIVVGVIGLSVGTLTGRKLQNVRMRSFRPWREQEC